MSPRRADPCRCDRYKFPHRWQPACDERDYDYTDTDEHRRRVDYHERVAEMRAELREGR